MTDGRLMLHCWRPGPRAQGDSMSTFCILARHHRGPCSPQRDKLADATVPWHPIQPGFKVDCSGATPQGSAS